MKTLHGIVLVTFLLLHAYTGISQNRPNIVFILADDLGYASVNSFGADRALVRTPHIDQISASGMRFTNAHAPASICTPTRYGFLTGRYPWRSDLKFGVTGTHDPLIIETERATISGWLKNLGYRNAAIGKWHLGYGVDKPVDYTGVLSPGPLDLGFEYHFGVPQNHGDIVGVYVENDHVYGLRSKKVAPYSRTYYGPQYVGIDAPQRDNKDVMQDLTDKTISWLSQQNAETPFFLYFAAVAVHHPITPSDYMRGKSDCGPYGDFIQDLDMSVGRIVETLEYMGLMDNTILIFTSDNGGEIPSDNPNAPEIQALNAGLKANGDLRGDKHTIWEGGTRVPLIFSWPGHVEEATVSPEMINILDVFATLADITGGGLPDNKEIAPDSHSFYKVLTGSSEKHIRQSMVTADANGMHAIQMGEWKYIDDTPPEGFSMDRLKSIQETFKPRLFNLDDDPGEEVNLYEDKPEMVEKLKSELKRIRSSESTR